MTLSVALPLMAAAQGLFMAALLATHRTGPRVGNRLLAGYFAIFAAAMARIAAHSSGYILTHPHLTLVLVPFELLYGPLIYGYVRVLTGHRLRRRDLRHILPAVLVATALTPIYLWPAERKLTLLAAPTAGQRTLTLGLWILNWLLLSAYLVAAMRTLHQHGRRLRRHLSTLGRAGLEWLRTMLWVLVAAQVVDLLATVATFGAGAASPWWGLGALGLVVLLYALAFFALRQPELRYAAPPPVQLDPMTGEWARPGADGVDAEVVPVDIDGDEAADAAGKYERSGLAAAQAEEIAARIRDVLDTKRLHVRSDLSLADLSALVEAPTHHVSQVLNERLGGSFFDVINGRRVEEAKRMLADPRKTHLSVLTIGFDAGFNSKTAFNTAFKAHAGCTPTAYRRQALAVDRAA